MGLFIAHNVIFHIKNSLNALKPSQKGNNMLKCNVLFQKLKTVKQLQLEIVASKTKQWTIGMMHYANSWQPSHVSTSVNDWFQLFTTIKKPRKKLQRKFKCLSYIQITLPLRINLHVSPLRISWSNQPATHSRETVTLKVQYSYSSAQNPVLSWWPSYCHWRVKTYCRQKASFRTEFRVLHLPNYQVCLIFVSSSVFVVFPGNKFILASSNAVFYNGY